MTPAPETKSTSNTGPIPEKELLPVSSPSPSTSTPPPKRQKREQYRKAVQGAQQKQDSEGDVIKLPQKKFFRQRAHANPFSDHRLD